jgi:chemotaxis protein histidine kinase CheA
MDLTCSILESISSYSVRWKDDEYQVFRQAIADTLEALKGQPGASTLLVYAGTVSQRIEQFQRNTQQQIDGSVAALNDIIRILLASTEKVHADSAASAGELHEIEETIRSARTAEELQATKSHLVHALGRLRERTLDQVHAVASAFTSASEQAGTPAVSRASTKPPAPPPAPPPEKAAVQDPPEPIRVETAKFDAVTGLSGQTEAHRAVLALSDTDRPNSYIVAFYVRRMEVIRARFGEKLANDLLLFCAQQIARLAGIDDDNLFRWKGQGAFVAIVKRESSSISVRQEMQRTFGAKMTYESKNGSTLLPINISTHVMHVPAFDLAALMEGIEQFLSSQTLRQQA